ncbi:aromatic ring-hydroxylating dioxygenase subunit alpha [Ramlibacter sp. AW1]|uniref:Aromatic ring-hydroxylating dioxygenase subunit alpha n=1 Tax=Ramlibacter aurantiacus TaxID=2801330 RepID=A0A937D8B6_9BURK|nr:aromatic ring-hydroxylating dioxygenase subunit alpha [Ramlibacter aurantiacus]MBL0421896.1 aromatic ring-hydroxylating dioxygenase subunit alpha [Ramlibacter aurantiacus]
MTTPEQNETLTRVGKGTRMGELLRRYWHPVALSSEFEVARIKKVKILGEELVLYRDQSGTLGLIDKTCRHRGASLEHGIIQREGIRCAYHGWQFNERGKCLDRPCEPEGGTSTSRIEIKAYPVIEKGGLLFAYLGPAPAPEFPRFEVFEEGNVVKTIGYATVGVNWLQIMENSMDPVHVEWLHGHFSIQEYGRSEPPFDTFAKRHVKIAFEEFEYGIIKKRLLEGQKEEESSDWTTGHPMIFPNMLLVGDTRVHQFQIRVPVDDVTTLHYWYNCFRPADGVDIPDHYPTTSYEVPTRDSHGQYIKDYVDGQDIMLWESQGAINDRTQELLGTTDRGIVQYRRMLIRESDKVARGEDPMCVFRQPVPIHLPVEENRHGLPPGAFLNHTASRDYRYAPNIDEIVQMVSGATVGADN